MASNTDDTAQRWSELITKLNQLTADQRRDLENEAVAIEYGNQAYARGLALLDQGNLADAVHPLELAAGHGIADAREQLESVYATLRHQSAQAETVNRAAQPARMNKKEHDLADLEMKAHQIQIFSATTIPDLLQTPRYSLALSWYATPHLTYGLAAEDRAARQKNYWSRKREQTGLWVILDEGALHRQVGGADVMREQILHLVKMSDQCTLQIVPFKAGGYPGTLGAFTIFDLSDGHVVYVHGHAKTHYLTEPKEIHHTSLRFGHTLAVALEPAESRNLLTRLAYALGDGKDPIDTVRHPGIAKSSARSAATDQPSTRSSSA